MKLNSRIFICAMVLGAMLVCVSCKNFNESFYLEKTLDKDSTNKLNNTTSEKLTNADSLSAVFDENGNIIEFENDSTIVSDTANDNKIIKNYKEISTDKKIAGEKPKAIVNAPKLNTTQPKEKSKQENAIKTIPSKIISKETNKVKNIGAEINTERDHTLQKSNHSVPDL